MHTHTFRWKRDKENIVRARFSFSNSCSVTKKCQMVHWGWCQNKSDNFSLTISFSSVWFQCWLRFSNLLKLIGFECSDIYISFHIQRWLFFFASVKSFWILQTILFILWIHWIDSNVINIRLNWLIAWNIHFWIYSLFQWYFQCLMMRQTNKRQTQKGKINSNDDF